MGVWTDLGISSGTGIIVLIALYFVIKWAVRNGIKEAYSDITDKKTSEETEDDYIFKSYRNGTDNESGEGVLDEM